MDSTHPTGAETPRTQSEALEKYADGRLCDIAYKVAVTDGETAERIFAVADETREMRTALARLTAERDRWNAAANENAAAAQEYAGTVEALTERNRALEAALREIRDLANLPHPPKDADSALARALRYGDRLNTAIVTARRALTDTEAPHD